MTLLDRLERFIQARRERRVHDLRLGLALVQTLRATGGGMARPAPEPCPVCGRGTAGGHRHEPKGQPELAQVVRIGGGR